MPTLPIDEIYVEEDFNCRRVFDQEQIDSLAAQIEKHGLLSPPSVIKRKNNKYRIVAGERRFRAIKSLGRKEMEVRILPEGTSESELLEINLVENIERANLTFKEEARSVYRLLNEGYDTMELSKVLKKSPSWVVPRKLYMELKPTIQRKVDELELTQSDIKHLHGLPEEEQRQVIRQIEDIRYASNNQQTPTVKQVIASKKKKSSRTSNTRPQKLRTKEEVSALALFLREHFSHYWEESVTFRLAVAALFWASGETSDTEFYILLEELIDIECLPAVSQRAWITAIDTEKVRQIRDENSKPSLEN